MNVLAKIKNKKVYSQLYENDWLQYLLFCKWVWNVWSMDCINVPYWAVSSFPFVDYFSGTLSSDEEWWLGWEWSSLEFDLGFYIEFCLTVSCVHLDLLVFGSYLDIDLSNFMLDQDWVLEILKFVLVLELFKFANIWKLDFGWWIF